MDVFVGSILDSLRQEIARIGPHLATVGFRYYRAPTRVEGLSCEDLVWANDKNVSIETLPTSTLCLTVKIEPSMVFQEVIEEGVGDPKPGLFFQRQWINVDYI